MREGVKTMKMTKEEQNKIKQSIKEDYIKLNGVEPTEEHIEATFKSLLPFLFGVRF